MKLLNGFLFLVGTLASFSQGFAQEQNKTSGSEVVVKTELVPVEKTFQTGDNLLLSLNAMKLVKTYDNGDVLTFVYEINLNVKSNNGQTIPESTVAGVLYSASCQFPGFPTEQPFIPRAQGNLATNANGELEGTLQTFLGKTAVGFNISYSSKYQQPNTFGPSYYCTGLIDLNINGKNDAFTVKF